MFKTICGRLRREGKTLAEICKTTGRSKTTVWYHIKDIPLPPEVKGLVREERTKRLARYVRSIRGKSKLDQHPIPFTVWEKDYVLLVAHLLFDGSITTSGCLYYNRNEVLLSRVCTAMHAVYSRSPIKRTDQNGVSTRAWYNVELAAMIRHKADELLTNIESMDRELQRAFLRALFDDEGCISYSIARNTRMVRAYQHNCAILDIAQRLLMNFGIESRIDGKQVELIISRRHNLVRFRDEIGFSAGVCVNGKRSNSMWKRSLEKRSILDLALASYLPIGTPGVHRKA